jgi:hypothetical protein
MDTINRVWHGEAGLARTYWLFGGLCGVLFWVPLSMVTPGSLAAVLVTGALGAFLLWVNMGVWRAAAKYEGPAIWSGLARAAAALGFVMATAAIGGVLFAVATGSWREPPAQQESFDPDFWKKGGTPVN